MTYEIPPVPDRGAEDALRSPAVIEAEGQVRAAIGELAAALAQVYRQDVVAVQALPWVGHMYSVEVPVPYWEQARRMLNDLPPAADPAGEDEAGASSS